MRKSFKYRLYPSKRQAQSLEYQLAEACRLYNGCLQERRDAYRMCGVSLNYYDQAAQLKAIRADGALGLENFSCCQDVLRRVDKTFKAFFRRVRRGERAGYPRFKPASRFDSITFPSYGDGCHLLNSGRLKLQGVGQINLKLHRPLKGRIKTVTVKREAGRWYAVFSCECEPNPLPARPATVGVDVGLSAFATLSDGSEIVNPRHYQKAQAKLRVAQRRVARRNRRSNGRKKAVRLLQRAHARIKNQRSDFHHKVSRSLVNAYGLIAAEDLNVKGLAGGMLAKQVNDAGWGSFLDKIAYKAEEAGRVFIKVNPNGTSQTCLCGAVVPKTLRDRWHQCDSCGLSAPRDHVSAQLILRLGLSLAGLTWASGPCVPAEAAAL